jgi:aspartate kinase
MTPWPTEVVEGGTPVERPRPAPASDALGAAVIVHKFGGTSLADAQRIGHAADLVAAGPAQAVVVVSATAGTTDQLAALIGCHQSGDTDGIRAAVEHLRDRHLGAARALTPGLEDLLAVEARTDQVLTRLEGVLTAPAAATGAADPVLHARLADEVTSAGEDLSAELMAAALDARGRPARVVDARTLIRSDTRFGHASPLEDITQQQIKDAIEPLLAEGVVPVIQGFVAATVSGVTTTLGRGGSDLTAAILGSSLGATEVWIWTDVDGMLSADPRAVAGARHIAEIGFEEAVELAYFGAKVIHPRAAQWAVSHGLSLRIRNSFDPGGRETRIRWDRRGSPEVAAVAYKPGVILIKVRAHAASLPYGFLARVFEVLARHELPVDLVATSHSSTAFTIDEDEEVTQVGVELNEFADVEVVRRLATVTVVGHGLLQEPGVSGRMFEAVGSTPIHLISQASDVSVSFLVDQERAPAVVQRIHDRLVERRSPEQPSLDPSRPPDPSVRALARDPSP